ncbi:MAG: hypothetical protein HC881_05380 [Leptolyngbyaceae cyanobacterium SL_7_1]|nr:hypothetical protein [Leptolyngbyaceae cyanobacterium SL_7_1]
MTKLLEQAIARLKTLPTDEQDAIATLILEELDDEQRWDESFACSPDVLAELATEAMAEFGLQAIDKPEYLPIPNQENPPRSQQH